MLHTMTSIGGKIVKADDKYLVEDNNSLEHLTISKTTLNPGKNTNGHSHDGLEEVYIFTQGYGRMRVGESEINVFPGAIVTIQAGQFHRVFNPLEDQGNKAPLVFLSIFEKYNRDDADACVYDGDAANG